jgi:hypothetical protein
MVVSDSVLHANWFNIRHAKITTARPPSAPATLSRQVRRASSRWHSPEWARPRGAAQRPL